MNCKINKNVYQDQLNNINHKKYMKLKKVILDICKLSDSYVGLVNKRVQHPNSFDNH